MHRKIIVKENVGRLEVSMNNRWLTDLVQIPSSHKKLETLILLIINTINK